MNKGRPRHRFSMAQKIAPETMPAADYLSAERLFARLVARAFAADHPGLFGLSGQNIGELAPDETPPIPRPERSDPAPVTRMEAWMPGLISRNLKAGYDPHVRRNADER